MITMFVGVTTYMAAQLPGVRDFAVKDIGGDPFEQFEAMSTEDLLEFIESRALALLNSLSVDTWSGFGPEDLGLGFVSMMETTTAACYYLEKTSK